MRFTSKKVSCFLIICLCISVVYANRMTVVSEAGNSKTGIRLQIDNQIVTGKAISIKEGKKKSIKVNISKKKKYKITFRSNKSNIVSVSKTGKITGKRAGTAKVTVIAKHKKKKYKSWVKIKVVSLNKNSDDSLPAKELDSSQEIMPTDSPTAEPIVSLATEPTVSSVPDTGEVSDMYEISIRVNEKDFSAKLYQTETAKAFMQKLPLSISMKELNGNEKYHYFSENFPTDSQRVSEIHAGDLKLYGSSCLVLFYESFSTSYSYTSLGYVENPEGLAEALGNGNVSVTITSSE